MKKKALKKDFRTEIKKSLNRFLSIFFIVAMGVAFFSGIQASAPDMRATGDAYFDDSNLMDLRVISTLGITEDDLEAIGAVEGVQSVTGCYMEDVYCGEEETQEVLHIESLPENVNTLTPEEGRIPEKAGECFLDASYALKMGYKAGDTLEVTVSSEDDTLLRRSTFTISGYGYSPGYVSFERGSTTLGTGALAGFVYILPEDFDSEVYSVAYIQVDGAKEAMAYTDEYDNLIETVYDRIEAIEDLRCELRYDEVMEEAQEALDDAKQEVEDGKKELEDAKKELEDGKIEAESELSEAESELIDGEQQLEDGKAELSDAREELADGEQKVSDGEQEIADNETKLEDAKAQIAEADQKLSSGEAEYQSGLRQYNSRLPSTKKQLEAAQKEIDEGKAQLEAGWSEYNSNLAQIESGEQQLAAGEQQLVQGEAAYEAAKKQLDEGQAAYEAGMAEVTSGKAAYEAGKQELDQKQAAYEDGMRQYQAARAEYEQSEAQIPALEAAYAARESEAAALQAAYEEKKAGEASLQEKLAQAQDRVSGYDAEIAAKDSQIAEKQNEKAALHTQIEELERIIAEKEAAGEDAAAEKDSLSGLQQQAGGAETAIADLQAQKSSLETERSAAAGEAAEAQNGLQAIADAEAAWRQADGELAALGQSLDTLAAAKQTLEQKAAELAGAKEALDAGYAQLAVSKEKLDAGEAQLTASKQELDAGYAQLSSEGAKLEAGKATLASKREELAAGRKALEAGKAQLTASEKQLEAAQKQVDDGYKELEKAKAKLNSARKELDAGWAQLAASRSQLADGERQLSDARSQLSDARKELADAREQIADAEKEIADNEQKIKDGWEDYEEGKKEAEEKIADGEQKIKDAEEELLDAEKKIADAEDELARIKFPQWYVDDRSALPENSGFGENAERLSNIAKVFPVLFFLVAALISLTTMTRMVEEERTQIGTLKALGYSKVEIASKYMKYAFLATVGGSIFGVLVGEKIFPWIIINAYGIMYQHLPVILIPYNWEYGLIASGVALFCTLGATLSSCYRELQAVPAQLMRPPSPKQGKRIWLEYLPFIWRRMSFTWKSTVRNLMRYKKRFLMTVIGIGGCMGLLLVGYGLRDSIMDIGVKQFRELQIYDAMVILDSDADVSEQQEVLDCVSEDNRITDAKRFYMQKEKVHPKDGTKFSKEWAVYVYVPEDNAELEKFLNFRNRETGEPYTLTDGGAIITEKIAKEFGISAGDSILLERDDEDPVEIPIADVCENYLSHYIYLTPALYEQIYGEKPEYNSIFFGSDGTQEVVEEIGGNLLKNDAVLNITYTRTMEGQIDNMLGALDIVIVVLIISAGMLAFVVLYNLNNININERRRELATIKVLGFYDGEVAAYVYRENILLTIIGVFLGIFIGKILHAFIITTVEVDACMFGRNINFISYVYGTLFTIAFSVIVNVVMYFKLKKIDMVESLKSIE